MTDHALERLAQLCERQRVSCRSGQDKINIAVGLKDFTDSIAHARSPPVLAIRWREMRIGLLQCGPGLRTNRRDVITRKFMALDDHLGCLLREFLRRINQHTRDCLTVRALGLRSLPGKSLSTCSPNFACSSFISYFGHKPPNECLYRQIISRPERDPASILPKAQGQSNFVNDGAPKRN